LGPSLALNTYAAFVANSIGSTIDESSFSGLLARGAQHERELIAQRTRDALQAAKARGKKLGNPNLATARKRAIEGNKASAARHAANILPVIREIQASGIGSLRGVARALPARDMAPARGGAWTPVHFALRQSWRDRGSGSV
jgi:DNA invertase Pin-like site-specific DNA recombinase